MKINYIYLQLLLLGLTFSAFAQIKQASIDRIDAMPDLPKPLKIIDWKKMALDFDQKVYDFNATGEYWPLVWMDTTGKNFPQPVVGMYTAIGDVRQGLQNNKGMFHEALANMGAVMGASLVGINKSDQAGKNYVKMLKNYYNRENGWNIMMNNTAPEVALLGGGYGRDWWYDVYPNLLFYAIYDRYPQEPGFEEIARKIANRFYSADSVLNGNYNYSFFDYAKMKPVLSEICAQPDAAAGHAWVLYNAYRKFGDKRYLSGAISAMKALHGNTTNPTYEVLMPFGAYMAAVLNAEQQTSFDLQKMLNWSLDGTAICREGWGCLVGNWNGYDISGTMGSTVDHGGYAFLMNTFDAAWPLIPMVRYEPKYASAIGKWMLNAVNASRFFYPQYLPEDHQTLFNKRSFTKGVIAYEGFSKMSTFDTLYTELKAPVAQGDGPKWVPGKNPDVSQFSVYGSGHVGIFGSIVQKTNVEGILRLDLLATDFFRNKAYPTYLYYNPFHVARNVIVHVNEKSDIYDAVSQKFVARGLAKKASVKIPGSGSSILVVIPQGKKLTRNGSYLLAGDVIIDYKK